MAKREQKPAAAPRHSHALRTSLLVFVILVLILSVARLVMPSFIRDYVNRTLDKSELYSGKIGDVQVHLWRGAYSIHDITISKKTGDIPVPLFAARRVDFSVQWDALWHRRVVGRMEIDDPELNFVQERTQGDTQTGSGGPWLEIIRDLFPFRINSAVVKNGSVHFRAFGGQHPLDVYLSKLEGKLDNLGNIRDETKPLVSTVRVTAMAMDQAKFEYNMTLDPFSYRPTFKMAARLLGLDVTRINDLAMAYGKFNFKHGWFDLVVEADAKEGILNGYAKPLFRNLQVFELGKDIQGGNVLQLFWQALVGAVTRILTNPSRDQFGTLIPFTGDLSGATTTDILATIGNVLRNAFVRAYLPRLEGGGDSVEGLQFGPAELSDPLSAGDPKG